MATSSSNPSDPQLAVVDKAIAQGIDFLRSQYWAEFGLLQESPDIGGMRIYWTNDNLLAAHTLAVLGIDDLAAQIHEQLAAYASDLDALGLAADRNNFIEVAWGEAIPWPPYRHRDVVVKSFGEQPCDFFDGEEGAQEDKDQVSPCLFYETHLGPGRFYDWSSYANLACMGVINEWTLGNAESARRLFEMKMTDFDGYGFGDAVYWQDRPTFYETLGLAWCLYAAALIDAPVDQRLLDALLRQQNERSGGFHTHYRWD
ncbi:MAG: hypothetical protein KF893_26585, partial [Caldilineaceae bacterium]|nr:hypothetical protein [Caldilineaceae bacterium]